MRPETLGGLAVSRETRRALCEQYPVAELSQPLASGDVNRMRGGPAKAGPSQRGSIPWKGKVPGELRARFQSKPLGRVADSHAEKDPEGARTP